MENATPIEALRLARSWLHAPGDTHVPIGDYDETVALVVSVLDGEEKPSPTVAALVEAVQNLLAFSNTGLNRPNDATIAQARFALRLVGIEAEY